MAGACECGNEPSDSIKFGNFFFFFLAEDLLVSSFLFEQKF